MSFQEKSCWVSLVGLAVAFGGYVASMLTTVLQGPAGRDITLADGALFIGATIVLVVVLVVGNAAIAIIDRRTQPDERDREIELRGGAYGSYVLATGVFLALCTAVLSEGNALMAHVLLGFWVLAQGVELSAQLVMYRRGA